MKKPRIETDEKPKLRVAGPKKAALGLRIREIPDIPEPHLELVGAAKIPAATSTTPPSATSATSATSDTQDSATPTSMTSTSSDTSHTSTSSDTSLTSQTSNTDTSNTATIPSTTSRTSHTSSTTPTSAGRQGREYRTDTAPARDFQKVPNSITRQAIPEGLFKSGKSKQCYDVLYALTRGAIEPTRTVRISKPKLMKLASIGSRVTLDNILNDFKAKGLVVETVVAGEHMGNEIEVFTPEEVRERLSTTPTSSTSHTSGTSPGQFLGGLVGLETSGTSRGSEPINTGVSPPSKTLFKDFLKTDDDVREIEQSFSKLNLAAIEVTGKALTSGDWRALTEIIGMIIDETALAAARTSHVSAYMKFAAENLRRRLYARPTRPAAQSRPPEPGKSTDYVADPNFVVDEPEPLNEQQRVKALKLLQEIVANAGMDALANWRPLYAEVDWAWLTEQLRKAEEGTTPSADG